MNTKQLFSMWLVAVALAVSGCAPSYSAIALNSTPAPQRGISLSQPTEVHLETSSIAPQDMWNLKITGNSLIATAEVLGEIRPIMIDLDSGQVQGLESPLRLGSTEATSTRYIPRWTSYYDKKTRRQVGELFVFDLQQGKEFQIADNLPDFADVSGSIVVWQGWGNGGWGIYGYDIGASQPITIDSEPGLRGLPRISGNWVIYLDIGQGAILHVYNVTTGENLTLGSTPFNDRDSSRAGKYHLIGRGKVVWADAKTYNLHVYDLNTRATEILTNTVTECKPLFWLEAMAEHTLLYFGCKGWALYDLDRKSNVDIPAGGGRIVMSDSRVVWQEGNRLYTARIER